MPTSELDMSKWQEIAQQTLAEVASITFNCELSNIKVRVGGPPPGLPGAFIAIMTPSGSVQVQIGLVTSEDGCHEIASRMLGLGEGERLPTADMIDAMGEILNIIAGAIKGRLDDMGTRLKIGFPWFTNNLDSESLARNQVGVSEVKLGEVEAALLVAGAHQPNEQVESPLVARNNQLPLEG